MKGHIASIHLYKMSQEYPQRQKGDQWLPVAAEREGITANGNEASFRGRESSDISDNQCAALIEYTENHQFIYT